MQLFPQAAHFQLTRRCNLACKFCGQSKGVLGTNRDSLRSDDWMRIAHDIGRHCERPELTLWGGEPLLYGEFDELSSALAKTGAEMRTVTNGTLIDHHAETLCRDFDVINVSFDGYENSDDFIRGPGTFRKAAENLSLLKNRKGKLYVLLTVADGNLEEIPEYPELFAKFGIDCLIFQPLMYLTAKEIDECRQYSLEHFGCDYPDLPAYLREDGFLFDGKWNAISAKIAATSYSIPVRITPHGTERPCKKPQTRVHVRYDGEVGFCTDYFGFSAGNVKNASIIDLFNNDRSKAFRDAVKCDALPICRHCAWRNQQ